MLIKLKNILMRGSRNKKFSQFMALVHESSDILDVGVNVVEFSPYDNILEKKYPFKDKITALSIDECSKHFKEEYPDVKFIKYDGGGFPFLDNMFDSTHSNAVIEHVGGRHQQVEFIKQMLRVTKKYVFFTTPSRYFPIETHTNILFLHYLPKKIFDMFLKFIGKEWATGNYLNLLSYRDLVVILDEACKDYTHKVDIIKNRTFLFTSTFSVIIEKLDAKSARNL